VPLGFSWDGLGIQGMQSCRGLVALHLWHVSVVRVCVCVCACAWNLCTHVYTCGTYDDVSIYHLLHRVQARVRIYHFIPSLSVFLSVFSSFSRALSVEQENESERDSAREEEGEDVGGGGERGGCFVHRASSSSTTRRRSPWEVIAHKVDSSA